MNTQHAKAQAFLEDLAEHQPRLPFEPTLLPELFAVTGENAVADADTVANLVSRSQNLAVRVLTLANSAYYGFCSSVSSLSQAIRVLGMTEVRNLVLGVGAAAALSGMTMPPDFNTRRIWSHQVKTAIFVRKLAVAVRALDPAAPGAPDPDELYSAGLLHDIGKMLIAGHCPEDWLGIRQLAQLEHVSLVQAEDEYWGIDHSMIGSRLLCYWQLPARLTEPVSWHHAPELADAPHRPAARLLAAANILAEAEWGGPEDLPEAALQLLPDALEAARVFTLLEIHAACDKAESLAAVLVP